MTTSESKMGMSPRQIHAMNCSDSQQPGRWTGSRAFLALTAVLLPISIPSKDLSGHNFSYFSYHWHYLNHTRVILSLPLHWSSREDAILNRSTSQNSTPMSCWAKMERGALCCSHNKIPYYHLKISCSVKSGTNMWGPFHVPPQYNCNCILLQSVIPIPSSHSSRCFTDFQASIKHSL